MCTLLSFLLVSRFCIWYSSWIFDSLWSLVGTEIRREKEVRNGEIISVLFSVLVEREKWKFLNFGFWFNYFFQLVGENCGWLGFRVKGKQSKCSCFRFHLFVCIFSSEEWRTSFKITKVIILDDESRKWIPH